MLYLRRCEKCRGDMFMDKDHYGSFLVCLQCGFYKDLEGRLDVLAAAAASAGARPVAPDRDADRDGRRLDWQRGQKKAA